MPIRAVAEAFSQKTGTTCVYDPALDSNFKDVFVQYPDILALTCYDPILKKPLVSQEETRIFGGFCGYRKIEYEGHQNILYTSAPMVMINGVYDVNLRYAGQLKPALAMASALSEIQSLDVRMEEGHLNVSVNPVLYNYAPEDRYTVWLVTYKKGVFPNPDEVITAVNPIISMTELGKWQGAAQNFSVSLKDIEAENIAVFVQKDLLGKIIAAGRIERITPPLSTP